MQRFLKKAMSPVFMRGATLSALKAKELETPGADELLRRYAERYGYADIKIARVVCSEAPDWPLNAHHSYVIGAIMQAACSMESAINEVFKDAADGSDSVQAAIGESAMRALGALGECQVLKRKGPSVLSKYQIFLMGCGKSAFNTGRPPYQDAKLLSDLRNELVHYKPEFVRINGEPQRLEKKLESKNMGENPYYAGSGNPFFPDKCLSYGCAKWAVQTSYVFIEDFLERIQLQSRLEGWKKLKSGLDRLS